MSPVPIMTPSAIHNEGRIANPITKKPRTKTEKNVIPRARHGARRMRVCVVMVILQAGKEYRGFPASPRVVFTVILFQTPRLN
jgi:hypothetical protein